MPQLTLLQDISMFYASQVKTQLITSCTWTNGLIIIKLVMILRLLLFIRKLYLSVVWCITLILSVKDGIGLRSTLECQCFLVKIYIIMNSARMSLDTIYFYYLKCVVAAAVLSWFGKGLFCCWECKQLINNKILKKYCLSCLEPGDKKCHLVVDDDITSSLKTSKHKNPYYVQKDE